MLSEYIGRLTRQLAHHRHGHVCNALVRQLLSVKSRSALSKSLLTVSCRLLVNMLLFKLICTIFVMNQVSSVSEVTDCRL
jgi:hypothetical protein